MELRIEWGGDRRNRRFIVYGAVMKVRDLIFDVLEGRSSLPYGICFNNTIRLGYIEKKIEEVNERIRVIEDMIRKREELGEKVDINVNYIYNLAVFKAIASLIEVDYQWWVNEKSCKYCKNRREKIYLPHYWWERYCLRHATLFWFRDIIYLEGQYARGSIRIIYDDNNDLINQIDVETCSSRRCGVLTWTPQEVFAMVFAPFRYRNYGDPKSSYCVLTRLLFRNILIATYSRTLAP